MVQVKVNEGILEGEKLANEFGGEYYSFKGIPYAEPPVGTLRFKAPQPKKPWSGVCSAKAYGDSCVQLNPTVSMEPFGSEDCLFLNVFTPDLKPRKTLPVMFWIHGGGFRSGSGDDDWYGPEFLIQHDIILVTFNYRVEALGFLSLDTEDMPGNQGMKDQVAALRWVKSNIKNFGGDSENITIFGESAGGASTSYHLVSPMTKGLFKRAIVQSGSLLCSWAQTVEPRERALKLAKQLGCNSEDDKVLVEFFRSVPAEKLIALNLPITKSAKIYELSFAITHEKKFGDNERFFYVDEVEATRAGIHEGVELMTGYTEDEGLIVLSLGNTLDDLIRVANEFNEFFVPAPIQWNCSLKQQLDVGRKIKEHYFKKDIVSKEKIDQLMTFLNWDMFLYGGLLLAKLCSIKTNVYLYKMTCKSERNIFSNLLGLGDLIKNWKGQVVCHADDLFYLFPFKFAQLKLDQNSETYTYIKRMTTLWTNFAKFGNPTPDASLGVTWPPYSLSHKTYMEIGNQLAVKTNPDQEDELFWDSIYKEYLPRYAV